MTSPHRFRSLAAPLFLAAALTATSALAQDPGGARVLLDEAARAGAAGDHATALERYRAAYARDRQPSTLFNIATALHRLGRYPEAGATYEKLLREPGATSDLVANARRALAEVDARVARVTIASSDPGARVFVDGGELVGFAPGGMVRLAPGEHTIAAGRTGPAAAETIRVAPGEERSVWLRLPGAAPQPVYGGGSPGVPGSAPMPPVPIVLVAPPAIPPPPDEDEPPPRRREGNVGAKVATGLLFGFGGISLMGGMAAGVYALVRDRDASRHCLRGGSACEPEALDIQSQARAGAQISSITMAAGLGLVITGSIVAGVTRVGRRAAIELPRVAVVPTRGGAFAALEASW